MSNSMRLFLTSVRQTGSSHSSRSYLTRPVSNASKILYETARSSCFSHRRLFTSEKKSSDAYRKKRGKRKKMPTPTKRERLTHKPIKNELSQRIMENPSSLRFFKSSKKEDGTTTYDIHPKIQSDFFRGITRIRSTVEGYLFPQGEAGEGGSAPGNLANRMRSRKGPVMDRTWWAWSIAVALVPGLIVVAVCEMHRKEADEFYAKLKEKKGGLMEGPVLEDDPEWKDLDELGRLKKKVDMLERVLRTERKSGGGSGIQGRIEEKRDQSQMEDNEKEKDLNVGYTLIKMTKESLDILLEVIKDSVAGWIREQIGNAQEIIPESDTDPAEVLEGNETDNVVVNSSDDKPLSPPKDTTEQQSLILESEKAPLISVQQSTSDTKSRILWQKIQSIARLFQNRPPHDNKPTNDDISDHETVTSNNNER